MSAFTDKLHAIEAGLKADWSKLEADARAEYEKVLGELKADATKIEQEVKQDLVTQLTPLITRYRTEIEQAIEAAGPSVTSAVSRVAEKLITDLGVLLGGVTL